MWTLRPAIGIAVTMLGMMDIVCFYVQCAPYITLRTLSVLWLSLCEMNQMIHTRFRYTVPATQRSTLRSLHWVKVQKVSHRWRLSRKWVSRMHRRCCCWGKSWTPTRLWGIDWSLKYGKNTGMDLGIGCCPLRSKWRNIRQTDCVKWKHWYDPRTNSFGRTPRIRRLRCLSNAGSPRSASKPSCNSWCAKLKRARCDLFRYCREDIRKKSSNPSLHWNHSSAKSDSK